MRVLMLSQSYPPVFGGLATHVRTLSIELVSHGHDVTVATQWYQGMPEFELDHGVRVYRFHSTMQHMPWLFRDSKRHIATPFPDPGAMMALRQIIKKEQPEIVHAHNWLVYSFLPLKVWSGVPLVVTLHDYNLVCAKLTMLYHDAPCEGPALAKCLSCASQHYGLVKGFPIVLSNRVMSLTERGLVDMFMPNSEAVAVGSGLVEGRLPFQVIPHFIPRDEEIPQGDPEPYLAQLPTEDYLLYAGSLSPHKGVDVLLRAYAGLTNPPPLVLIGHLSPGWQLPSEAYAQNVVLLKDWPRFAVLEAWRRSLIGLVPSVWSEPFGLVVLEAMSAGRPVIASRTGGIIDIVADGETGLLVQPGDPLALRQAIERLVADAALRNHMGQAAQRKFKDFEVSALVPRFERVYQGVLQEQQKTKPSQKIDLPVDSVGAARK